MDLKTLCESYDSLGKQIAQLELARAKLAENIITTAGHDHTGQKTYQHDGLKVTITTKDNYTLDKARLNVEWSEQLPINRSYSYTLREKDFKAMLEHGTSEQKQILSEIVTSKPAKPVIKVEFK